MDYEHWTYYDLKRWFWIRTWMWSIPVFIISIIMFFFVVKDYIKDFSDLIKISLLCGVGTSILGVFAAYLSIQLPWMRLGWKISYVINGPVCILIGGLASAFVSGIVYTVVSNDIDRPLEIIKITNEILKFVVISTGFWSFIYGFWFAFRKDKYFIEPI